MFRPQYACCLPFLAVFAIFGCLFWPWAGTALPHTQPHHYFFTMFLLLMLRNALRRFGLRLGLRLGWVPVESGLSWVADEVGVLLALRESVIPMEALKLENSR